MGVAGMSSRGRVKEGGSLGRTDRPWFSSGAEREKRSLRIWKLLNP